MVKSFFIICLNKHSGIILLCGNSLRLMARLRFFYFSVTVLRLISYLSPLVSRLNLFGCSSVQCHQVSRVMQLFHLCIGDGAVKYCQSSKATYCCLAEHFTYGIAGAYRKVRAAHGFSF